jgi:hypothetical protein
VNSDSRLVGGVQCLTGSLFGAERKA